MKFFSIVVTVCAFLHSIIALILGDYGYSIGLFGGAGAWLLVALIETPSNQSIDSDKNC